jgi:hypothetical protein
MLEKLQGKIVSATCASLLILTVSAQNIAFDVTLTPTNQSGANCVHEWHNGYIVSGGGSNFVEEHSLHVITDEWGLTQRVIDSVDFRAHSEWSEPTRDGGFISADESSGINNYETSIRKYDSSGNWQWSTVINPSPVTAVYQVRQTTDNGFIAVCRRSLGGSIYANCLFKLNNSGNNVWSIDLDTTDEINLTVNVFEFPNGNLVARLGHDSVGYAKLAKLTPNGNFAGFIYLPDFEWAWKNAITSSDSAHIAVVGRNLTTSMLEIKILDSAFTETNRAIIPSPPATDQIFAMSIEGNADLGYVVACRIQHLNGLCAWIIRLDPDLQIEWEVIYDLSLSEGYYFEYVTHAILCTDNGVIFTGERVLYDTTGGSDRYQMFLVKLDSLGRFAAPGNFNDDSPFIFPNPANSTVNIIYPHASDNDVIEIYDMTGRIVKAIAASPAYANDYSHNSIFVGDLAQGAYLCRLRGNPRIDNLGKLIVTGME